MLGIQITSANLQNPEAREGALRKMRAWERKPVYKLNGEAAALKSAEGEEVPIVFFHLNSADVASAWEKVASEKGGIDWRKPEVREFCREAAEDLPQNFEYVQRVLSSIAVSLDIIASQPGYRRLIEPYQKLIRRELEALGQKQ